MLVKVYVCLVSLFQNYYTLALTDGKIEGRFSGNSIPQIITSLGTYNDGRTHTVGVLKKNRM